VQDVPVHILARLYLRRRQRNASLDLGLHPFEAVPAVGEALKVPYRGVLLRAVVVSVILQGLPDLDGVLIPLVYLAEL
jgi:hypothetical protein